MYNKAFRIETEGHMLNGSEVNVDTDDDDIKQELEPKAKKILYSRHTLYAAYIHGIHGRR